MRISDRNYTILCTIPLIQTAVAGTSAIMHCLRLLHDLGLMLTFRKGPVAFNQHCDQRIKKYPIRVIYPLTLDTSQDANEAFETNWKVMEAKNHIASLKVYPSKHLYNMAIAIISATPVVGTLYNSYQLYSKEFPEPLNVKKLDSKIDFFLDGDFHAINYAKAILYSDEFQANPVLYKRGQWGRMNLNQAEQATVKRVQWFFQNHVE